MRLMKRLIGVFVVLGFLLPCQSLQAGRAGAETPPQADIVARVSWHESTGLPAILNSGLASASAMGLQGARAVNPQALASAFIQVNRASLALTDTALTWEAGKTSTDQMGISHSRMYQMYQGLPVLGGELILHTKGGSVTGVNGQYLTTVNLSFVPAVTLEQAFQAAAADSGFKDSQLREISLIIFNRAILEAGAEATNHLAYKIVIEEKSYLDSTTCYISAVDKSVLLKYPTWPDARNREVWDLNGSTEPTSYLIYNESGPVAPEFTDAANAYTYSADLYNYWMDTFSRDSYNAGGATMKSIVRWGQNNAVWDGQSTVFGTGFAVKDVVAHEWTHAVTESEISGLPNRGEQGALGEALCDIFACMVDRDDWGVLEEAPIADSRKRRLDHPAVYTNPTSGRPYPEKYAERYTGIGDSEGVHINCTIIGHAAYLMADGGTYEAHTVQGIGREYTEQIFYRAQCNYVTSATNFYQFADQLLIACSDLYGQGTTYSSVYNALAAVELATPTVTNVAVFRTADGDARGNWYIDSNHSGGWNDGDTQSGPFGRVPGDIPLAIDWDGNGTQELCIFRPGEGNWYIDSNHSGGWNDGDTQIGPFGRVPGDIPLAIDWDGNGQQELCIFRPGEGTWYIDSNRSGGWNAGDTQLGPFGRVSGDIPLAIDWDGNGQQELCIFRPGEGSWYIDRNRSGGWNAGDTQLGPFGRVPGDIPLAIDWDGNGQQELCIFRPGEGTWYIDSNRSGGWNAGDTQLGPLVTVPGDRPVVISGW